MTGPSPDVAVVGGGICGLTTALALQRRGVEATVYEAASDYRPVGAGILLQTNALLALERLGIADRVADRGVPLSEVRLLSPSGRVLKRADVDRVERAQFGRGYVAIHRASLQELLLDELDAAPLTGKECVAVDGTKQPTVRFADDTAVQPDVLVGADGIRSVVREGVAPGTELASLDAVVYRAVVPVALPAARRAGGVEVWGTGTYTGGAPVADDAFYWFATAPNSVDGDPVATFRERLADHPEPIPTVLDSLEGDDVFATGLSAVPSLPRWHRDSVALAGDAAHGMLPFAGQGAAQGIEDALVLAAAIYGATDPADAFASYEAERKPRADRIRAEARRLGLLSTVDSRVGVAARNGALSLLPAAIYRRMRRRRAAGTSLPTDGGGASSQG